VPTPSRLVESSPHRRRRILATAAAIALAWSDPAGAEPPAEPTEPAAPQNVGEPTDVAEGEEEAETEELAERELMLHGLRAPSIGLEFREQWMGFHVGLYPAIVDEGPDGDSRTTWFIKTGVTFYPIGFDAGPGRPSGPYAGVALLQGLGNDWDVSRSATKGSAVFFDLGFRWAVWMGLDIRIGVSALLGFDGRTHIAPTPGISWSVPF
jgi:hypothetical protein